MLGCQSTCPLECCTERRIGPPQGQSVGGLEHQLRWLQDFDGLHFEFCGGLTEVRLQGFKRIRRLSAVRKLTSLAAARRGAGAIELRFDSSIGHMHRNGRLPKKLRRLGLLAGSELKITGLGMHHATQLAAQLEDCVLAYHSLVCKQSSEGAGATLLLLQLGSRFGRQVIMGELKTRWIQRNLTSVDEDPVNTSDELKEVDRCILATDACSLVRLLAWQQSNSEFSAQKSSRRINDIYKFPFAMSQRRLCPAAEQGLAHEFARWFERHCGCHES